MSWLSELKCGSLKSSCTLWVYIYMFGLAVSMASRIACICLVLWLMMLMQAQRRNWPWILQPLSLMAEGVADCCKLSNAAPEMISTFDFMAWCQYFLYVGLSHQWRHKQVHPNDDNLESVTGRLTRVFLMSSRECIGTAARIQQDELCVSSRHVFVDGGSFLQATGWGSRLQFVASSPHDDIFSERCVLIIQEQLA